MKKNCSKCGKPANIHYKKTVNGKTEEYYLCSECAEKSNVDILMPGDLFFSDSFSGDSFFSDFGIFPEFPKISIQSEEKCPVCKKSIAQIKNDGKFGCSECYKMFISRYGKNSVMQIPYKGKKLLSKENTAPEKKNSAEEKIIKLKKELAEAVASENYEKAAFLRDEIKKSEV